MKEIFLSVIIPAFNEEKVLPETLNSVLGYLRKQPNAWELIVVDDLSEDRTKDLVLEFKRSFSELRLIENKKNFGKGFSVKAGMLEAKGEIALFMDADNSTKILELEKALPLLRSGSDMVIGSRRLKDSKISKAQPFFRRFSGEFFRIFTKLIFGFGYDDTQAGFKVFNRKSRQIFHHQTINRWSFDVELLWLAKKFGLSVAEIPIEWENNKDSRVRLSQAIKFPFELLRIRFKKYRL